MTNALKKLSRFLCLFYFSFSAYTLHAQSLPGYIKQISKKFNAEEATIRINNKLADYSALSGIADTLLLKVELYQKKEAIALYGKEEGRNGVLLVTLRKHADERRGTPQYIYHKNGDSTYCEQQTPATLDHDTTGKSWLNFLVKNLNAAAPVDAGSPPGLYIVYITFTVDAEGNVTDLQIPEDPGYGTSKEVRRLMKTSPKWQPGTCNGSIILYRAIQRVTFMVNEG